ncbi:MAG: hypothetical protein ACLU80_05040 [Dorea sp.]
MRHLLGEGEGNAPGRAGTLKPPSMWRRYARGRTVSVDCNEDCWGLEDVISLEPQIQKRHRIVR